MLKLLAKIIIIAFFFQSSLAFAQTPASAYDFLKPRENYGLELSPNGKQLAFVKTANKKHCLDKFGKMITSKKVTCKDRNKKFRTTHTIVIYDLELKKHGLIIPFPENNYVGWLEWANDDKLLASVRAPTTVGQKGRGYSLGGSRIISIDVSDTDGDKELDFAVLFADQKGIQRQNRYLSRITNLLYGDPKHVMMPANKSGELDLWKVNIDDGSAVRIALGKSGTFYWYTDKSGKPVLRFDCSSRSCRKINVFTPTNEGEDWKKIQTFKVKPDADEDEYDFWPIAPTDNPKQIYVLSDGENDERRAIKIYDIETETFVKTVFEHPSADVSGALTSGETGEYIGAYFFEDRRNYSFTDKRLQKHYNAINKYFEDSANIRFLGYDAEQTKAVVYVTATDNPGAYYIYDFKTSNIELIFFTEPEISQALNSQSEIIQIPTRDGITITAYRSYPNGKKHSKLPLLVMPHGGPESRDIFDFDLTSQYFVARGYQTIQMNFRGSSGKGKKFAEAGYGEWGGIMQNDLTDTVRYMFDKQLAVPENTCIVGYSYGGYAALYGGATTPELYKCIVSGGGLSDLLLSMKNIKRDYGSDSETYEYWLKSKGDPKAQKENYISKSPVNMAENFLAPVLLIHGEDDDNVYPEQSKKMEKALKKANKAVEMLILKDEGHSNWSIENDILYHETIEAFLAKYLTGQAP